MASNNPPLPIVMAVDEAYLGYASVAIASLFANASDSNPEVHVLTKGISKDSADLLAQVARRFGRTIVGHLIDASAVAWLGGYGDYISNASFWRLYCGELRQFDRVLYLDADVIVEADVGRVFETGMGSAVIAGVMDSTSAASGRKRLALPADEPYLNAGVLLIDTKRWREEGIAALCLDYARRFAERIYIGDQDIINAVLQGRKILLDRRWNLLQSDFLNSSDLARTGLGSTPEAQSGDFFIAHFSGIIKPWMEWSDRWSQTLFDRYRLFTALKNEPRVQPTKLSEWMLWAEGLDAAGEHAKSSAVRKHIILQLVGSIEASRSG